MMFRHFGRPSSESIKFQDEDSRQFYEEWKKKIEDFYRSEEKGIFKK